MDPCFSLCCTNIYLTFTPIDTLLSLSVNTLPSTFASIIATLHVAMNIAMKNFIYSLKEYVISQKQLVGHLKLSMIGEEWPSKAKEATILENYFNCSNKMKHQ